MNPNDLRRRLSFICGLSLGLGLLACGSPDVPLTRPPQNAFRVDEAITTPPTTDPQLATLLEQESTNTFPSILALTARFWGLNWPPEPPILFITARFWGLTWPPFELNRAAPSVRSDFSGADE